MFLVVSLFFLNIFSTFLGAFSISKLFPIPMSNTIDAIYILAKVIYQIIFQRLEIRDRHRQLKIIGGHVNSGNTWQLWKEGNISDYLFSQ